MVSMQEIAEASRDAMWAQDRASRALGITILEVGPGRAKLRMTVRPDMCNGHHLCHGGMIFTLSDSAFAFACNSHNKVTVANNCSIAFIASAREGDVLTAALVGALNRAFGRTTFTEIFCPDWAGNALFLSHMGEINPEVVGGPARLCERPFPFTKAQRPAIVTGAPRPGPATLVNLSPGPDDTFRLLIVPVEVLADTANPAMRGIVRGWIRPSGPVPQFLERYSELGGTHHSALVLGHHTEALTAFAEYRGWEPALVG